MTATRINNAIASANWSTPRAVWSHTIMDCDNSRDAFTQSGVRSFSAFASVSFVTAATIATITTHGNYPDAPAQRTIGIHIDGAWNSEWLVPDGMGATRVRLPTGRKTVTIIGGTANRPTVGGTIHGVQLQSVEFNRTFERVADSAAGRLTILGDSGAVGAGCTSVQRRAWPNLLRLAGRKISVEAYGYRTLHEEAADASAINASVARLMQHLPSNVLIELGTNDYAFNRWSAAAYQAGYANLLTAINAALPTATIYVLTPIPRTGESSPNGLGSNLAAYRSAAIAAAAGRSYCSVIDGTAAVSSGDLVDGVHVGDAGNVKMADYVGART